MQQSQNHGSDRSRAAPAVRNLISWIVDADRKFRMTQNRIDRFADRF